jgi:hypothetical protein
MAWWHAIFDKKDKDIQKIMEVSADEIAGLNFKTALEAHIKWKHRLKDVINGSSTETLDPEVIGRNDMCVLGKWINSEGARKFAEQPGFVAVVGAHTHFHKCAANTLRLAQAGELEKAEADLNSGDYARASLEVSRHLMRLWRDVGIEK